MRDSIGRILIVDDSPDFRALVRRYLQRSADKSFVLFEAETGEEGLNICRSAKPDCILLDYRLPDLDGLEFLSEFNVANHRVPIIMLTGQGSESVAVAAMKNGAQDYLVKDEIDSQSLLRSIRYAVERTKREMAEQALRETQDELAAARQIQQRLFPNQPPQLDGFEISGGCRPASATGGDYFDYIPIRDGHIGIVVADVSSHGLGPALVMAGTRRLLRTLVDTHDDIGQIFTLANHAIGEDTDAGQFVTMFFAAIDPQTRVMNYVGAGHAGYLIDASGSVNKLDSTSLPLSVDEDAAIECGAPITLQPGSLLAMLTDGFEEAESPAGELFGTGRGLNVLAANRDKPAQQIVDLLFKAVNEFCSPNHPQDDLTVVVVKVL